MNENKTKETKTKNIFENKLFKTDSEYAIANQACTLSFTIVVLFICIVNITEAFKGYGGCSDAHRDTDSENAAYESGGY